MFFVSFAEEMNDILLGKFFEENKHKYLSNLKIG